MRKTRDEERAARAGRRANELMAGSGDALMCRAEMAALLGVTVRTVDRWERAGVIPRRRKVGKRAVGWRAAEIREWLASCPVGQKAS